MWHNDPSLKSAFEFVYASIPAFVEGDMYSVLSSCFLYDYLIFAIIINFGPDIFIDKNS